jgi:hypothetical protein
MVCYIKNKKTVRIRSVKSLGKAVPSETIDFMRFRDDYKSNRSQTVETHRNKTHKFTATATSINSKSAFQYSIVLEKGLGRIYINKTELPEALSTLLWANREKLNTRVRLSFTGKWLGNSIDVVLFSGITKISN